MPTITEAVDIAIGYHQAGNLPAAEQIYRQILAVDPNHPDALHLLGVIAIQVGNAEAAVELIRRAIGVKGTVAAFHGNLGMALKALGKLDDAIACCRRALELNPNDAEAYSNMGNALEGQGKHDEAIASFRKAIELKPDHAEAYNNLANALTAQGKLDDAVACCRRALELRPNLAEPQNNLGNALKAQGRVADAAACYRRAIELAPNYADAYFNLGLVLLDCGELDESVACNLKVVKLKPSSAEAYNNLARALTGQSKLEGAVTCCKRALELKPDLAEAHNILGNALNQLGKPDEALACLYRAVALKPDYPEAYNNLGIALRELGRTDEAIASYRRSCDLRPDISIPHSAQICTLSICPGYDAHAIYEESRRWNQRHAEPLARLIQPHPHDRSAQRRLRIGYISTDFRDHVVGYNLLPLFREHDHGRFEIICYADVQFADNLTGRFRSCADTWREALGLSHERLAQVIREDQVDVLVDLNLHTVGNRLKVFARKPAPVQVTFAGYPGTTGLTAIDYRLTDPYLDPPGLFDPCYSEQSVRLPDTFWCYEPLSEPEVNPLPALANGCVTFGCLNNFCKINPGVLRAWAQVMNAVDRSRILILANEGSPRQRTLSELEREGITPERVLFVGRQAHPEYLRLYNQIDIALDTWPYNGHTTSLDSFWMGVPVITMVGQTVVGRAGLSQLTNLGLPELIAETPEQFVQTAVALASDLPRLSNHRATLRHRMEASPLMDAPRFARGIEAAYRMMWERWCTT